MGISLGARIFSVLSSVCIHVVYVTIYILKPISLFISQKNVKKNLILANMSIPRSKLKDIHVYP